uniref:Crustacean hyperglycemic hormone n=1 Tax=Eurydice pulchra TaxID=155694 RepID=I6M4D6_EURPU|nr:crustacean hyperglycemic hormone precursor [Eurydice pulchra]
MFSSKLSASVVAVWVVVLLCIAETGEGRNMEPSTLDRLNNAKAKRQVFDASCKGIYDRELFSQLERVCEDCYNLYRKPVVATECRRECYTTEVFESCLRDLMMHDLINEYKEKAYMVAGKK